jgi:NAD-dependent SIR2 family protein deacetylase
LFVVSIGYAAYAYYHSPWWNRSGLAENQPVLFSHRHHAGELHIDCRYCHASAETSSFAGLPSTQTCLSCHSQIFHDTTMLRPVVVSAETNRPLRWNRVTAVPDHVYFDHSIHLAKGVGCTTCHGPVGNMALTAKGQSLEMRWCIDCHRDPAPRLRPRSELFSATLDPNQTDVIRGHVLLLANGVQTQHLTNCSTCHR